jgi:hypothetical protein
MRTALGTLIFLIALAPVAGMAGADDWLDDGNAGQTSQARPADPDAPNNWVNPNTGVVGTFTSDPVFVDANGRDCREYAVEASIAGHVQQIFGLACLDSDGRWREASTSVQAPPVQAAAPVRPATQPDPSYADLWAPYYAGEYAPAHPYRGWDWWYPFAAVALSASYCVDGFCFGGSTGYPRHYGYRYPRYSSWWHPFRFGFGFRGGHGHYNHYNHYGYRKHHYKKHKKYRKHHYKKHKKYRKHHGRKHGDYRRHKRGGRGHRQFADRRDRKRGKNRYNRRHR